MTNERHITMTDGTPIWVAADGLGPPVVLLHGGPGLWDYLEDLADLLVESHTVYRYDQRGCGRSGGEGPYTPDGFVHDLDDLRTVLGIERWTVIGHSWGADLALRYTLQHPDHTQALIYIGGTGLTDNFKPGHKELAQQRLGDKYARWEQLGKLPSRNAHEEREFCLLQWRPDFSPSGDPAAHALRLWETRPSGVEVNVECNRQVQEARRRDAGEVRHRLPGLSLPMLIIHGQDDPRSYIWTDEILELIPNARRVVIPDAGHAPWAEQPAAAADAIASFIDGPPNPR